MESTVGPQGRVIALFCYLFKQMINVLLEMVNLDCLCVWNREYYSPVI